MTAAAPTTDRTAPDAGGARAARSLRSDLGWLRERATAAVEAQPLAAVATAVGIGFVLGGGLTRPMLGLLIQTGSRIAANRLAQTLQSQDLHGADEGAEEDRG